jgi:hypothetical protein
MSFFTGSNVTGGLGGVLGFIGQQQTNQKNWDMAQAANAASAEQAANQMAFQERMRDTQYQTAVRDMKSAGLNPMLAYSQGGAGTPSGAMGQVSTAKVGNSIGAALAGAQSLSMNEADIDLKKATTTGTSAATLKTEADTIKTATEIAYILENTKLNAQQQQNLVVQLNKLNQEIENLRATQGLTTATTAKTKAETGNIEKGIAPSADPFFYRDIKRVGEYTKDKLLKYKNLLTPTNPFKGKK